MLLEVVSRNEIDLGGQQTFVGEDFHIRIQLLAPFDDFVFVDLRVDVLQGVVANHPQPVLLVLRRELAYLNAELVVDGCEESQYTILDV